MNSWCKRITENDRDLLIGAALDSGSWGVNFFEKYGCVTAIKNLLLEQLKKYPQQKRVTPIPKIQTAWTRLKDLEDLEPSIDLKEQIKSYIASATIWEGTCLDFWKRNLWRFPAFEPLLQKYLSFCASTAAVERVFSTCGHLISKRRNKLSSQHVEIAVFLKYYNNIFTQEKENKKLKTK